MITFSDDERVRDVSGVVDAEANGQDNIDAGNGVDRDVPEVEKAHHVHLRQKDRDGTGF